MSGKATGRAWDSGASGADLLVLLALADKAGGHDDDFDHAYPSVQTICSMTKLSRRTVQMALGRLKDGGYIRKTGEHKWGGSKFTNQYRIEKKKVGGASDDIDREGGASDDRGGASEGTEGAHPDAPNPSITRPSSSLRSEEPDARPPEDSVLFDPGEATRPSPKKKSVTYRGVKASSEQVDKALAALAVFNELKSGRAISPWTGTKHPSEQFKQIVGQVLDHPEVTADEWEQVVRNVFTNPPSWCAEKGTPPCIGDIFGPKAMGYALENNGVARRELSSGGQRRPKVSDFAAQLLGGGRSE